MERFIRRISAKRIGTLFFAVAAVALSGLLWINNVVAAWNIRMGLADGITREYFGMLPVLEWSAADPSTVSTLVPFLSFLLISHAILFRQCDDHWPFVAGYDRFNTALGIAGTLWCLIGIGFIQPMTFANGISRIFFALIPMLSTIVWSAIAVPLLRISARVLVLDASELDEGMGIAGKIERSLAALRSFNRELERSGSDAYDLRMEIASLSEELGAGRRLSLQWRNEISVSLRSLAEIANSLQERQNALVRENSFLCEENEALHREKSALEADRTQVIFEKENVVRELNELRSQLESMRNPVK